MLIPLIPKDRERNDFNCRDGEIDFTLSLAPEGARQVAPYGAAVRMSALNNGVALTAAGVTALHNVRIPLLAGERPKAELMLSGEISRVDPATAERLTQAMVEKAAEVLLDLSTDLRRQGLFILPFRYYTMIELPDGTISYPSPQGVALPTDRPPHPEIAAASVTDDCLTLALQFPVKPHRLTVLPSPNLPSGHRLRTFISYPLYIPDPKEMRGSIGSVMSATGGQATGIRFGFLSQSALKASVAAPEKYYELVGNERTGYRFSSKAAAAPDYSCYAPLYGYVPPFPRESLLAPGEEADADADPLDWIADWVEAGDGYLPASLPYKYWHTDPDGESAEAWPDGIDGDFVLDLAERVGATHILLTRPMCFASDSVSRRHAEATAIRSLRAVGLPPGKPAHAILYGSDDGLRWEPLRRFDPRPGGILQTPWRLFWRLLTIGAEAPLALRVFLTGGEGNF